MNDPIQASAPKAVRGCYYLTLIASLIGAAIQMILLLSEYDTAIGMYRRDSVLAGIFIGFVILVTVLILAAPLLSRREPPLSVETLPAPDTPLIFASTLCGFILVAVLILQSITALPFGGLNVASDYFWLAVLVLSIPSAVYFFLPALPIKRKEGLEKALSFFPVLWCMTYLMCVYFDKSAALSSPVRILTQLAMIASMLFFLSELAIRVGRGCSRFLAPIINCAIFFSAICAIPLISVAFINQWVLKADILYSAVQLCFLTYFIARANTLFRR